MKLFLIEDTQASLEAIKDFLNKDDLAKASAFKDEVRKRQFLIGRAAIGFVADKIYGIQGPITLKYNEHQKPFSELFKFNISHSKGLVALVTDPNQELGLDVQFFNSDKDLSKALARYSNDEDIEHLYENTGIENQYKLWCIKEALGKYTGKGIHAPLKSFKILHESDKIYSKDNESFAEYQCYKYKNYFLVIVAKSLTPLEIYEVNNAILNKVVLN